MPTIKINQKLEYDIEDYTYGDTFKMSMQFFKDDTFTVKEDVSNWQFFMDIKPKLDCCPGHSGEIETLAIGSGISHDVSDTSIINFLKVLVSTAGKYNQTIRSVEPDTTITTREQGGLKIDPKV